MRLSCAGYTFNSYFREKGLTLEKYADICAEMGLDGVELTQYYFPETGRAYLNDLKRHLLRRGLLHRNLRLLWWRPQLPNPNPKPSQQSFSVMRLS